MGKWAGFTWRQLRVEANVLLRRIETTTSPIVSRRIARDGAELADHMIRKRDAERTCQHAVDG